MGWANIWILDGPRPSPSLVLALLILGALFVTF